MMRAAREALLVEATGAVKGGKVEALRDGAATSPARAKARLTPSGCVAFNLATRASGEGNRVSEGDTGLEKALARDDCGRVRLTDGPTERDSTIGRAANEGVCTGALCGRGFLFGASGKITKEPASLLPRFSDGVDFGAT